MKFVLATCCLAAVFIFSNTAAEIVDEIGIITTECAKEFKIPAESRKELEATIDKTTFDASDDFKCFSKCGGEKIGLFVDGKLNFDRLIEVHKAFGREESKIREYAAHCKDQFAKHVDCNSSWDMFTCFHNQL